MHITKKKLKKIIQEELQEVLERGADLHNYLQEIAWWMEENGIYHPKKGVIAWLKYNPEHRDKRQALLDMSEEIYDYMD